MYNLNAAHLISKLYPEMEGIIDIYYTYVISLRSENIAENVD